MTHYKERKSFMSIDTHTLSRWTRQENNECTHQFLPI